METKTENKISTQQAIESEDKYGAHNYHPIPVVLERGEGVLSTGMLTGNDMLTFYPPIAP